ncbi:hypothetical protein NAEGRDRAFT_63272 [Naegleria gruberi]|uniref:F-box domain-containing protein n=1 Tax=Naegleria gruberi TaxID=5762 RepID=D2V391_NAEGR|nr:uncharacterized protein NAEGRDRAFT_63272 [Naegleria gruberi]EFC48595.1 hypothetical protein NAEGRDRAFT_63272 [Naegleria gruberi]|eukprot:XP_002681339.1 hypothetical protein NAEGRDRAFT_63272 [Naegleria gruberi strain NEG-M]
MPQPITKRPNLIAVLLFEVLVEIFKNLHFLNASPLKSVCREWQDVIEELFIFYPTGPSPFRLSVKKYYVRKHFCWNKMILNFLQYVVPKDCGVIPLVIRVMEHEQCFSDCENNQKGFQSKVAQIANTMDVKGYIQTQSSYEDNLENMTIKRVLDICCQEKPSKLRDFLEQVSDIVNEDGASSFIIRTTDIVNPVTQSPHFIQ